MSIAQLEARQNQVIDAPKRTIYLTFSVIDNIGLVKDFRPLEEGHELSAIKGLHDQMNVLGLLSLTVRSCPEDVGSVVLCKRT